MDYKQLASPELLAEVKQGLEHNGFIVHAVETGVDAKVKVATLLKEGSSVMQMTSTTLDSTGISELINASGKYDASRPKLYSPESKLDPVEKKRLGYAVEYTVGSVHAITKNGELVIASNTGSQMGAYVYGADKVIFVVGTHKIVNGDLQTALKRIYDYVLPLESERAKIAYGAAGSNVSKLLIINKEITPERIHIVLVNEVLGF